MLCTAKWKRQQAVYSQMSAAYAYAPIKGASGKANLLPLGERIYIYSLSKRESRQLVLKSDCRGLISQSARLDAAKESSNVR